MKYEFSGGGQDHDIMSPAVIKKEHDYLGLFEYNMNHEAEIMRALIYGRFQLPSYLFSHTANFGAGRLGRGL